MYLFKTYDVCLFQDTDEDRTYQPDPESDDETTESDGISEPGRKIVRRPQNWKRVKGSKLRNEGKRYTDRQGKVHEERRVRQYEHNCRFKCNENLSGAERQQIFDEYWKLGSWYLQTAFINSCVAAEEPMRPKKGAARANKVSCKYNLKGFRVCKQFFFVDIRHKQ